MNKNKKGKAPPILPSRNLFPQKSTPYQRGLINYM